MQKRKLGVLFLISLFILATVPLVLYRTSESIIYVAGGGSENFCCDGIDDQVQINQALEYAANHTGSIVYLRGPFTYNINGTLRVGSYTTLAGDRTAKVKLVDNAHWNQVEVPLVGPATLGAHDIIIDGFEIDGNILNQNDLANNRYGSGYYPLIDFPNHNYNITVQNMYLHDAGDDGLRVKFRSTLDSGSLGNVIFRNNIIYKIGHDAFYCVGVNNITANNNDVFTHTNSAFRLHNSNNARIYNNYIHSEFSGESTGPGIEIQRTDSKNLMDNIEIYDNVFNTLNGAAIWLYGRDSDGIVRGKNVYIHNNIIYNVGQYYYYTGYSNGGIVVGYFDNTTIENNVIDCGGRASIMNDDGSENNTYSSPVTTIVKNNILMNSNLYPANGILDVDSSNCSFKASYNCLYNNKGGNFNGNISSSNNVMSDPACANLSEHDYHLMSRAGRWKSQWINDSVNSPLIVAGDPTSDYSNEPFYNGNRINIGAYGNTKYESKSE